LRNYYCWLPFARRNPIAISDASVTERKSRRPYKIIQPPFALKFWEVPKKELTNYFRWFVEIIPERIDELGNTIRQAVPCGSRKVHPGKRPGRMSR
jgi:hypothetical protein